MVTRRPIQQQHEREVVRDFLSWLNARRGMKYSVISEPNPPEAIIRSVRVTRWVEVGDVFWSDQWARDLYSYATPDENHKPVPDGPYFDTDNQFSRRFVNVLTDKLAKKAYEPFCHEFGSGYLVLNVQYPFFSDHTVQRMKHHWGKATSKKDRGCFREVYVSFPSLNSSAFRRWHIHGHAT